MSGEIDADAHVRTGIFCASFDLMTSFALPKYEEEALREVREWFDVYLDTPFDYLPQITRYERAICWFKPTAHEHLARAWDLAAILERNDVLIWTIRSPQVGYVYYEDEVQVFARPHRDVRQLLRR